jgi:hypothetical protein
MVKNGMAIYFCSVEETAAARLLEVPQWMFEATGCYEMHLAPTLAICIETILNLQRLVANATSDSLDAIVRLRHHHAESAGAASARRRADRTISAVSDTFPEDSSVGGLTLRDATADRCTLSTTAARAPHKKERRKARGGDVR